MDEQRISREYAQEWAEADHPAFGTERALAAALLAANDALAWYAEKRNYRPAAGDAPGTPSFIDQDKGMRARAAMLPREEGVRDA